MKCPACGNSALRAEGSRPPSSGELSLGQCPSCGHVFQDPPTILAKYDHSYLTKYQSYSNDMSYLRAGFVKAFHGSGLLLDFGCGDGRFVKVARECRFDAYGYDIHGCDVGVRMVTWDEIPNLDWGVVTFFDSIEHVPDLHQVVRAVDSAKIVVVSTPCPPVGFPANRAWKHYKPGEHLHYFSRGSLARLFAGWDEICHENVEDAVRKADGREWNIRTSVFRR